MVKQLLTQLQTYGCKPHLGADTIQFKVKIVPKSSHSEIVGMLGEDTLKIKIAAIPEKNKANQELIKLLSEQLHVPKSSIRIKSGSSSPLKTITIKSKQ